MENHLIVDDSAVQAFRLKSVLEDEYGVTVMPDRERPYDAQLKIADTMLYDAKNRGRNRAVWADEQMKRRREK